MILKILTIYPLTITLAAIFYSLISQNLIGFLYAIGASLGTGINLGLKELIKYIFPKFKPFLRPNPPKTGCGYIPNCKNNIITYGMPSGHAQSAVTIAIFWSLYILNNYDLNIYTYLSVITIIIVSIMVGYSRLYNGCHNIFQVFVGSVIGLIYGIILYRLVDILVSNKTDKISNSTVLYVGSGLIIIISIIFYILV